MVIKKASAHPLFSTTPLSASRALLVYLLLFNIGSLASARCRPYSCGHLQDIGPPFRSKGDPHKCGDPRYQLACVDGNKTIWDIHQAGTYYVTDISDFGFTVVDADLVNGSCSLPLKSLSRTSIEKVGLKADYFWWATFVSCTRKTVNSAYKPVPCLSKADAFVYVILSDGALQLDYAERFCSFLAMTPITFDPDQMEWMDGSNIISLKHPKTDVFQLLKRGFSVVFLDLTIRDCQKEVEWTNPIEIKKNAGFTFQILNSISNLLPFMTCMEIYYKLHLTWLSDLLSALVYILQILIVLLIPSRFVIAPLAIVLFLAHKLWKEKKSVDAVEKFLRRQSALMPTRYAYTDLIAITSNFREKLGQGGYGSVSKGVLPGGVLVAVKMLNNSRCNGEEFINEVSTIGRIHHINVVKLAGFCSEGSKRALVYEYMPHG